ncbi:MAG TPA: hypothetical protein VGC46_14390, partial [Allosphingosinicella sp.]
MKLVLAAAALILFLPGCASSRQHSPGEAADIERIADRLEAAANTHPAVTNDPPRHPTHPARNRQLV